MGTAHGGSLIRSGLFEKGNLLASVYRCDRFKIADTFMGLMRILAFQRTGWTTWLERLVHEKRTSSERKIIKNSNL